MSKILQISDTHIVPHGQLAYGQVDTAIALDRTVESINRLLPDAGPVDWLLTLEDFTVNGLDSSVAGKAYGLLADESLDFLRDALIKASGRPVLIGFHHPPVQTGLHVMDQQNLRNADALAKVIAGYEGPLQILCGYVHRATTSLLAGNICQPAPGTSHAVTLDLRPDADNSLTKGPGAFMLHEWRNGGFLSHFFPVGQFDGPHPFY